MQFVFGLFNFHGGKVSKDDISSITHELIDACPSGFNNIESHNFYLAYSKVADAADEKRNREIRFNNSYFLFLGRIYNRIDLSRMIGISSTKVKGYTDQNLFLQAYAKWGIDCSEKIHGDWVFIIINSEKNELIMAKDHHGISSLYYTWSGDLFVFSTTIHGVLALQKKEFKPNIRQLLLKALSIPINTNETCYENIYRLPPAHHLTINAQTYKLIKYWFPENVNRIRYSNDSQYVEHFMELYTQSIRKRLDITNVKGSAIALSGGLDSGSIAVLAARYLMLQGKRLFGFTSVPKYSTCKLIPRNRLADESNFVRNISRMYSNIQIELINGDNKSPLDGIIDMLKIHGEPQHAVGNYFWMNDLMHKVKEKGLSFLLTGQGGNAIISWPTPSYFKNYLRDSSGLTSNLTSFIRVLKQIIPNASPNLANKDRLKAIIKRSALNYNFLKSEGYLEFLKPYFEKISRDKMKNSIFARIKFLRPGNSIIGTFLNEMGIWHNIEIVDPTLDVSLIEYCLGLPDTQFYNKDDSRLLIKNAMKDLLPKEVLENTKRGIQSADLAMRIIEINKEIENLLLQLSQHSFVNSFLDIQKIIRTLSSIYSNTNISSNRICLSIVLRGIAVGLFLKKM